MYKFSMFMGDMKYIRNYLLKRRNFSLPYQEDNVERHYLKVSGMNVRVYLPKNRTTKDLTSVIYYHGGGWAFNNLDSYDHLLRRFVERGNVAIYALEYHKAPEVDAPIIFQECLGFLKWVYNNANKHGSNPNKIVVAGDSAGAEISSSISFYVRDNQIRFPKISGVILIYGPYFYAPSNVTRFLSYQDKIIGKNNYIIDADILLHCWKNFAGKKSLQNDKYHSPLSAMKDFSNFPSVLFIQAGKGILLEEGIEFSERLKQEEGNKVEMKIATSMFHGFFSSGEKYFDMYITPWLSNLFKKETNL